MHIQSELLFTMKAHLKPPLEIGETPLGRRQIFHIGSGQVEGPRITGEYLSCGEDWCLMRPDGMGEVDVRGAIRTDDDAYIYVTYAGILNMAPNVWERLQQGDHVAPDEYYFRIVPRFQTGSKQYSWLNNIITIGVGQLSSPMGKWVAYRVYAIL